MGAEWQGAQSWRGASAAAAAAVHRAGGGGWPQGGRGSLTGRWRDGDGGPNYLDADMQPGGGETSPATPVDPAAHPPDARRPLPMPLPSPIRPEIAGGAIAATVPTAAATSKKGPPAPVAMPQPPTPGPPPAEPRPVGEADPPDSGQTHAGAGDRGGPQPAATPLGRFDRRSELRRSSIPCCRRGDHRLLRAVPGRPGHSAGPGRGSGRRGRCRPRPAGAVGATGGRGR